MRRLRYLVLVATLGACAPVMAQPGGQRPSYAGTYRIHICRTPCDPRTTADIASGTLVLGRVSFAPSAVPEPARSYFLEQEEELLVLYAENRPNACFVLRKGTVAGSYAGSAPVALTKWGTRPNGAIGLPLFQTPDAGYSTNMRSTGRNLVGRGSSWGPDSSVDSLPSDSIFAQRTGPPDFGTCYRAAAAEASRR